MSHLINVSLLALFCLSLAAADQCTDNPPNLNSSSGVGHVKKIANISCYVTGSPHSKLSIVLASDIYGYKPPNLRKLADKVATAGYYVVVPDLFHGDPYIINVTDRPKDVWLSQHLPENSVNDAIRLVQTLQHRPGSKVGSKVGAAGFCWGGKVIVGVAEHHNYLQAAVLLHPSYVTSDDIKGDYGLKQNGYENLPILLIFGEVVGSQYFNAAIAVEVPIAILGAEKDGGASPTVLKQWEDILKEKHEVDYFIKVYPNVKHGWTLRYDPADPVAVEAANEAHQDMVNWFDKNLKPKPLV